MRVFTCTPVRFPGDAAFMARDSGLFSIGLSAIGVESRPVLLGPPMDSDDPRVLRADFCDLESPAWWRTLGLDGLIFYSWAAPRYNGIARAIKDAGIPLLVNMDTSGLISPLSSPLDWWREMPMQIMHESRSPAHTLLIIGKALAEWICNRVAKRRIAHYEAATIVAAVTPHAALWIPNEAIRLGRPDLCPKFIYLPHPQLTAFSYNGEPKENLVISVGRWRKEDWPQKNPKAMMHAYRHFLKLKKQWHALVIGGGAPDLPRLLGIDTDDFEGRLEFIDHIAAARLPEIYRKARIGFWSSRWEGQQGTGAQALCCGCSVVSVSSAQNSCFRHYVTRESGRLATHNEPGALADELILEAESWERGERDPARISKIWTSEFHAPEVARRALAALGLEENSERRDASGVERRDASMETRD